MRGHEWRTRRSPAPTATPEAWGGQDSEDIIQRPTHALAALVAWVGPEPTGT